MFFNSKAYIEALVTIVAKNITTKIMLVVGPKDSGKSTAIAIISEFWKTKGHATIDINTHKLRGIDTMPIVSNISIESLSLLQFNSDKVSDLSNQCHIDHSTSLVIMIIEWPEENGSLIYAHKGTITIATLSAPL